MRQLSAHGSLHPGVHKAQFLLGGAGGRDHPGQALPRQARFEVLHAWKQKATGFLWTSCDQAIATLSRLSKNLSTTGPSTNILAPSNCLRSATKRLKSGAVSKEDPPRRGLLSTAEKSTSVTEPNAHKLAEQLTEDDMLLPSCPQLNKRLERALFARPAFRYAASRE